MNTIIDSKETSPDGVRYALISANNEINRNGYIIHSIYVKLEYSFERRSMDVNVFIDVISKESFSLWILNLNSPRVYKYITTYLKMLSICLENNFYIDNIIIVENGIVRVRK